MELVCDKCGSIGIWFPRDMVESEVKRNVEGYRARGGKQYPAHPGHVVVAKPDRTRPVI